jgi:RHS repeat-associated protein
MRKRILDATGRLQTITISPGTFAYTYKGPGTVWTNLALPNTSAITNVYDSGGRLTATRLKNSSGTILNKHDYLYNGGGQRQRQTLTDGSYTTYGLDDDGQLTSSLGYTSGGTPVTSQQLGFGYDAGWNMASRSVNGSPATYTVNDRNQLTMMTGPDYFTNDVNGNLTYWGSQSGWQRNLSYDDENRLVGVTVPGYYIGSYQYDGLSRLRVRSEQRWNGSSWVTSTIRYLYDGMCIVQERDGSNVPQVTYTRGKDLSGTIEGAGGIGGLLARSHGYSGGTWSTHNFYHADALGNVTYLVSSAQAMVANYKYDPYGRTISSGGTLASANVYRFSSKLAMDVPAMTLYYYGYRFYDAGLQRWLNRDPLGEVGGINLYAFVSNEPTDRVDAFGMEDTGFWGGVKDWAKDIPGRMKDAGKCLKQLCKRGFGAGPAGPAGSGIGSAAAGAGLQVISAAVDAAKAGPGLITVGLITKATNACKSCMSDGSYLCDDQFTSQCDKICDFAEKYKNKAGGVVPKL